MRIHPREVFTPYELAQGALYQPRTDFPSGEGVYAADSEVGLDAYLLEFLESKRQSLVLQGESGVGKSSAIINAAARLGRRTLRFACPAGIEDVDELLAHLVSKVSDFRQKGATYQNSVDGKAQAGMTLASLINIGVEGTRHVESETSWEVRALSPIEEFRRTMIAAGIDLVIIDNSHNIKSTDAKQGLGSVMEYIFDEGGPQIAIVGANDEVYNVGTSRSIHRRIAEVNVPRMSEAEIARIFRYGFGSLGMEATPAAMSLLCFLADGFPYYAHLIGLRVALAERRRHQTSPRTIDPESLVVALNAVADETAVRVTRILEELKNIHDGALASAVLELLNDHENSMWPMTRFLQDFQYFVAVPLAEQKAQVAELLSKELQAGLHREVLMAVPRGGRLFVALASPELRVHLRARRALAHQAEIQANDFVVAGELSPADLYVNEDN